MPSPTETLYAAHRLVAVTPHDTNDQGLAGCRALYVGGGGDVAVVARGDSAAVTLKGVPTGTVLPIAAVRVMATNTDASDIVALC